MIRHLVFAALLGLLTSTLISCASSEIQLAEQRGPANWDINPETYEAPPPETPPEAPAPTISKETTQPVPYFDWPVDQARFVRGFSLRPTGKRHRPHLGIDLASYKNTPILAAHNGTIIYVGKDFRGFGKMILIEGKSGWATLYAHLNKTYVREGMRVRKGDPIASMGKTGRASGVHLHFEIRKDRGPVDPMLYLPHNGAAKNNPELVDPHDYEE